MEFSRPEYWSGSPSPGDLPNPRIESRSPALQLDSLPAEPQGKPYSLYNKPVNIKKYFPEFHEPFLQINKPEERL